MTNPSDEVILTAASIINRLDVAENFAFTIDTTKYKVLPIPQLFVHPESCLYEAFWTLGILNSFNSTEEAHKNQCYTFSYLPAPDGVVKNLYSDRFRNTLSQYEDETDHILTVLDRLKEADNLSIPFPLVKCTDDEHRQCDGLQPTMVTFIVRTVKEERFLDIHVQQQECRIDVALPRLLAVWLFILKITAGILNCNTGKLMGNVLKIDSKEHFKASIPTLFKLSRLKNYEQSVKDFLDGGKECFYNDVELPLNMTYNDWEQHFSKHEFSCSVPSTYMSWNFAVYNTIVSQ